MFDQIKQQENLSNYKIKELKKIEEKNENETENYNLTNLMTSQNIPKMFYDTNMKLTLTRQTHEES